MRLIRKVSALPPDQAVWSVTSLTIAFRSGLLTGLSSSQSGNVQVVLALVFVRAERLRAVAVGAAELPVFSAWMVQPMACFSSAAGVKMRWALSTVAPRGMRIPSKRSAVSACWPAVSSSW